MSAFSAMDVAETGASFSKFWIDTLAHNIANVNTINPAGEEGFKAMLVVAQERTDRDLSGVGSGVQVSDIRRTEMQNPQAFDPDHPYADEDGYVTLPAVDLAAHMSDLIIAQRSFQANIRTIKSAEEMYRSSLSIGARR